MVQIDLMWQANRQKDEGGPVNDLLRSLFGYAPFSAIKCHLAANIFIHCLINMQQRVETKKRWAAAAIQGGVAPVWQVSKIYAPH